LYIYVFETHGIEFLLKNDCFIFVGGQAVGRREGRRREGKGKKRSDEKGKK
jgi:hypothetical protein